MSNVQNIGDRGDPSVGLFVTRPAFLAVGK